MTNKKLNTGHKKIYINFYNAQFLFSISIYVHSVSNMKKIVNKKLSDLKKFELYFTIICGRSMYRIVCLASNSDVIMYNIQLWPSSINTASFPRIIECMCK